MKLSTGVNFLHAAFTLVDPKSVKILLSHQYLSMLLRSARIKAVRRTLVKLTTVQELEEKSFKSNVALFVLI